MTSCTICHAPCPGTDDADDAWCVWCFAAYVAWEPRRPQGLCVVREAERARRAGGAVRVLAGAGRETRG